MRFSLEQATFLAALFFMVVGAFCLLSGLQLQYYGRLGPGPGYFPIWVGVFQLICASVLAAKHFHWREFEAKQKQIAFFESKEALIRVFIICSTMPMLTVCLDEFGYRVSIFVFASALPNLIGSRKFVQNIIIGLFCSFGIGFIFESWLGIQLPRSTMPFLRELGL